MEYVYAALLLHNSGKNITEKDVNAVLKAAGIDADPSRVKALIAALEGVNIEEAISQAAFTPVQAPAATTHAEAAASVAEEKKEEKKKEEAEETGMEGLSALFG
ncbi:MAG: 50S ribosomal protein P1 [Methanocellales archaeon]|nr:50S ribosomal protein P1 [Methanocellales archaeon]MDD3291833.1 50S ribosomal protein P1 [Methanocellales archaeon]MDD5234553.1 50S ribosomal protein P1 [Methanocellales archaeon]MDD5485095.1 50S ribosomal protein P1 [Methanocellales archaeon]